MATLHQTPLIGKGKLFNDRLDDPDRIVLSNEVIEAFWKQCQLHAT
jgi:hypothetical protein